MDCEQLDLVMHVVTNEVMLQIDPRPKAETFYQKRITEETGLLLLSYGRFS